MSSFASRMLGALRLEDAVYEQIEADRDATAQAAFVVVATSLVAAVGNALLRGAPSIGLVAAISELAGWALYAAVAYVVGVKLIPGPATKGDWGELARTLGFANTPRFLLLFVAIGPLAGAVRFVVSAWVVAATVVALRTALDIGTGRAIVVAIVSALAQLVIIAVALSLAPG